MTMGKTCARRSAACPGQRAGIAAAALAAILLAGCSSGHVGEDWQCPLAAGGSCASVAAADPAVPKAGAVQAPAHHGPSAVAMSFARRSSRASSFWRTVPRSAALPASSQAAAMASAISAASMSSIEPRRRAIRPMTPASMAKHSSR